MKKIESLQAIRALAALHVFGFHLRICYQATGGSELPVFAWGFMGVDVFFVLSGFVVAYSTINIEGPKEGFWFLVRRAARVYLGYWPFLLIGVVVLYYFNPSKLTLPTFWNSLFLTTADMSSLVIGIAWSLVFELFFYVLFSVLICLKKKWRLYLVLLLAAFILGWNFYWQFWHQAIVFAGAMPMKFFFSSLLLEFLAGCVLAYCYPKIANVSSHGAMLAVAGMTALALGLVSLALAEPKVDALPLFSTLYLGGFSTALISVCLILESRFAVKFPQVLVRLGDASYTLYLFHGFALDFVMLSSLKFRLLSNPQIAPYFWMIFVAAVALISYVYYLYFERKVFQAFGAGISKYRRSKLLATPVGALS